jgi:hypothetical protein
MDVLKVEVGLSIDFVDELKDSAGLVIVKNFAKILRSYALNFSFFFNKVLVIVIRKTSYD